MIPVSFAVSKGCYSCSPTQPFVCVIVTPCQGLGEVGKEAMYTYNTVAGKTSVIIIH